MTVQELTGAQPVDLVRARERVCDALALAGLLAVLGLLLWHVSMKSQALNWNAPTAVYTFVISTYVLSRFVLCALYRPPRDVGLEPTIAIIVPAFNEGVAVARTIHSCMSLDYPASKLEVVVVNDGSTDDTLEHMISAAGEYPSGSVVCVDLGSNQGKRAAMAAGIRATSAEILVFVDSDSMPAPRAVRKLVQGFADPHVGAISGLTYVRNAHSNTLTRMQAARYYVSFQLLKAGESALNAVACCSGCFAAYRRVAITPVLDRWENQRFLGTVCTYGDDRGLTNMLIRERWKTIYDSQAQAWTDAPDRYRKFFKQQLRWKKSWGREGPILLSHVWRTRPLALPFVAVATIAGLLSPIVVLYNVVYVPADRMVFPVVYLLGMYLVSMAYALFYRVYRNDRLWLYAFIGTFFYVAFSLQLLWALLRIRDGSWGTRSVAQPAA